MTTNLVIGERVLVVVNPEHPILTTAWFPKDGPVYGTVQRIFKNGSVAIAVEAIRNRSADGLKTLHIEAKYLAVTDHV